MKKTLTNYKLVRGLVVAGVVVPVATVVVYLGYNNFKTETNPSDNEEITTDSDTLPTQANYDGLYKGNTGVAGGLADVNVTVVGTQLTGKATYKGEISGFSISLPATITGTVSPSGVVSGTVKVSGVQYNQQISLSGTTNGQIVGNSMNCSYAISGDEGNFSGEITLTKN